MSFEPIENYGVIGNMRSIALIGVNGSIDFLCYPKFDSPSVFAALLDDRRGGCFPIQPQLRQKRTRQMYLPDTNILLTRFLCRGGGGGTERLHAHRYRRWRTQRNYPNSDRDPRRDSLQDVMPATLQLRNVRTH